MEKLTVAFGTTPAFRRPMKRMTMSLCLLLAVLGDAQEPPKDETLHVTLDEISKWPEYSRVEPNVPRMEPPEDPKPSKPLSVPAGPLVRVYGKADIDAALRRAREMVFFIIPTPDDEKERWQPMQKLPEEMKEGISMTLAYTTVTPTSVSWGAPRLTVTFKTVDDVLVPVDIMFTGVPDGAWAPKGEDVETWRRFALDVYGRFFGAPPPGADSGVGQPHPRNFIRCWGGSWKGRELPGQYRASVWVRNLTGKDWEFFLKRGADNGKIAAFSKALDGQVLRVGAREAAAIAARNIHRAWPSRGGEIEVRGAGFVLFGSEDLHGSYIGGINRVTYYSDPQAAERTAASSPVFGVWQLTVDGLTVWVAADTGRVTRIYGIQGYPGR